MASDQEDDRARQLEALRQHMVHPDTRWEPPAGLGLSGELAALAAGEGPVADVRASAEHLRAVLRGTR